MQTWMPACAKIRPRIIKQSWKITLGGEQQEENRQNIILLDINHIIMPEITGTRKELHEPPAGKPLQRYGTITHDD